MEKERTSSEFDLIIKLHKDGSILESRIEDSISKLQALFGKIISKVNSEKFLWNKIVLETVRLSERNWCHGRSEMNRRIHSIRQSI